MRLQFVTRKWASVGTAVLACGIIGWSIGNGQDRNAANAIVAQSSQPASGLSDSSKAKVEQYHKETKALLSQYCYECHGNGEESGGLRLDAFTDDASVIADKERWIKVLKIVRAGVMPPPGSARPTAEQIHGLTEWIKYGPFEINKDDLDPGRVTIHRLNRLEYRNTIRELLGVSFNADDEFPPDAAGMGLDNIADLLTMSPLILEKYLDAAEGILEGAFPSESAREFEVLGTAIRGNNNTTGDRLSFGGSPEVTFTFRNTNPGRFRVAMEMEVIGLPPDVKPPAPTEVKPADAAETKPGDATVAEPKPAAESVPKADGNAAPKTEAPAAPAPEGAPAATTAPPAAVEAKPATDQVAAASADPVPAPPPPPPPIRKCRLTVSLVSGSAAEQILIDQDFEGESKKFEFTFDNLWEVEPHKFNFNVVNPLAAPRGARGAGGQRGGRGAAVQAARIKISNVRIMPIPTSAGRLYFDKVFTPADPTALREYVRQGIYKFSSRAFRRPVDDKTLNQLVEEVLVAYKASSHFNDSLKPSLAKILCSPRFLFRVDRTLADERSASWGSIDEYSLASRLSYFLWSSMPDEELTDLAGAGALRKNLPAQINRMMANEKSANLIDNFSGQWLQTRNVMKWPIVESAVLQREGINSPTPKLTAKIRSLMRDETTLYFGRVVKEDRSALDFIDSDYTYLNEELAKYYAIPDVTGTEMKLVTLPPESPRGGVLTHGSTLLVTSNANRTSPVKRGVFVLDNFLGLKPNDPPPDVPSLEKASEDIKDHEPTFREMLELHRKDTLCASCHNLMDPIGFGLDNFNAIGIYRDVEFGQPIVPSGKLASGEEFNGIRELKQILKTSHRKDFYRCLTEKMLTYALGRGLEYYDTESVDRIVERLENENGKFSELIIGIIDSAPFQKRRNLPATAAASAVTRSSFSPNVMGFH